MVVMVVIVVVQRLEVSGMSYDDDDDDSTVLDDDVTDSTQWMCLCLNCKSICSVVVATVILHYVAADKLIY
jgi:hypothetical protein